MTASAPAPVTSGGTIPVWRQMTPTPKPHTAREDAPVVIVGGGPVGLTLALELGRLGRRVVVLNQRSVIAAGSKAICFAKRTLDIWDRLGVGARIVARGVDCNIGKVFTGAGTEPVYSFDMLPQKAQKMPGFVNIQQYHVEEMLVEAAAATAAIDLRWGHAVTGIEQDAAGATLTVRTDDGDYAIDAALVVACDGSRSPVRTMMGLDFEGRVFEDNFLIADIRLREDRPAERWFWFDPPFNPGQSALLHKQPDDVWRLDFQLGWDIDREACVRPENVAPYIRGLLGADVDFTPEWYSVYTFQCRRMARFVHGRVVFAGDAAHIVSPFGARGCNGGVADAANLGWKIDAGLRDPETLDRLLDSYDAEAIVTADENIRHSTRSTDFMTPKSDAARRLRDAVLELAGEHPFARPFVNSGRLSTAIDYPASPLSTPDHADDTWQGIAPGRAAIDAPLGDGWLLERLGPGFTLLSHGDPGPVPAGVTVVDIAAAGDPDGLAAERYDLRPGSACLLRPDHYVAARWRRPDPRAIAAALARAQGRAA